jgi:hypothetical protein
LRILNVSALLVDDNRLFVGNVGDTEAVVGRLLPDGQVSISFVSILVEPLSEACLNFGHDFVQ